VSAMLSNDRKTTIYPLAMSPAIHVLGTLLDDEPLSDDFSAPSS
jgi:hypothetical protein